MFKFNKNNKIEKGENGFTPIVDFDDVSISSKRSPRSSSKFTTGFTLVELMVATTVFVLIVVSSIGSLITLLGASKDSRSLRFAMDNVNFAMESMTRSIRMGVNYYCVSSGSIPTEITATLDCSSGGNLISFVPQTSLIDGNPYRTSYKLSQRADNTYTIKRCIGDLDSDCIEIISSDINIKKLKFFVNGSDPDDGVQASVYIMLKGTITYKGKESSFMIQTLASQRNF